MRFIISLALGVTVFGSDPAELDRRARAAFASGNYREAQQLFEQMLAFYPSGSAGEAEVLFNMAHARKALGETGRAEQALRRALHSQPNSPPILQSLGEIRFLQGHIEEAEALEWEAIQRATANQLPVVVAAHNALALVLESRGKKEQAAGVLIEALNLTPPGQAHARILANLGVLFWRMGDAKESMSRLGQAVSEMETFVGTNHPDLARILDDYAMVLGKAGKKSGARAMSERATAIRSAFAHQANTGNATVDWRDLK